MHGPGSTERMHQVPGAEEMMDQCAHDGDMGGSSMMGGGMMDGMMGG